MIALQNLCSRKKAKDLLFLCVNVAMYIHLSTVNQVPRKYTRNSQEETCFSNPAHLVMQLKKHGMRGREKKKIKLSYGMLWCLHITVIDNTELPKIDT